MADSLTKGGELFQKGADHFAKMPHRHRCDLYGEIISMSVTTGRYIVDADQTEASRNAFAAGLHPDDKIIRIRVS